MAMTVFLILALLVAMGFVVFAVIRGLHAFANMQPDDVGEDGVPKSLAMQNKMMFSRVKWQAIAVAIIAILLLGRAAVD
jgi:membrane-associated PAP2 superfamily phosphatase